MVFDLLKGCVDVASSIRSMEQAIRGGLLTDMLAEISDVWARSAREHLLEARASSDPAQRLHAAAGDLQNMYFASDKATRRGAPRPVRQLIGSGTGVGLHKFADQHKKAAGAAGFVAVLRWRLGEPPGVQRKWLDRAAKHASDYWRVLTYQIPGWHGPWYNLIEHDPIARLQEYFALERQILPAELIRPLPPKWRSLSPILGLPAYRGDIDDIGWHGRRGLMVVPVLDIHGMNTSPPDEVLPVYQHWDTAD